MSFQRISSAQLFSTKLAKKLFPSVLIHNYTVVRVKTIFQVSLETPLPLLIFLNEQQLNGNANTISARYFLSAMSGLKYWNVLLQKGSFNQLSLVTSVEQIDTGTVYLPTLLNQQNHMINIHVLCICSVLSVKHGQL